MFDEEQSTKAFWDNVVSQAQTQQQQPEYSSALPASTRRYLEVMDNTALPGATREFLATQGMREVPQKAAPSQSLDSYAKAKSGYITEMDESMNYLKNTLGIDSIDKFNKMAGDRAFNKNNPAALALLSTLQNSKKIPASSLNEVVPDIGMTRAPSRSSYDMYSLAPQDMFGLDPIEETPEEFRYRMEGPQPQKPISQFDQWKYGN